MGGTSTQDQTQSSTTAPWTQAQPALQGILGQLQGQLGNTGVTSGENSALNTIVGNSGNTNQFNPAINASTSSLLGGEWRLLNQARRWSRPAYNQYGSAEHVSACQQHQLRSYADARHRCAASGTTDNAITQQVNGQFAGAGRDLSGYNQKALGHRAWHAGFLAPVLTRPI